MQSQFGACCSSCSSSSVYMQGPSVIYNFTPVTPFSQRRAFHNIERDRQRHDWASLASVKERKKFSRGNPGKDQKGKRLTRKQMIIMCQVVFNSLLLCLWHYKRKRASNYSPMKQHGSCQVILSFLGSLFSFTLTNDTTILLRIHFLHAFSFTC